MRSAFRLKISQGKRWTSSGNSRTNFDVYGNVMNRQNVTKCLREFSEESSTTMKRCKKKSWRGSKARRHTSMTRGYRSWFQDLINVWTMVATILKNKVIYRQYIHSVAFVNWKCCTCLRPLYIYFPDMPRIISIWNKNGLPEEWKESIIVPIYKKGDKTDCSN